MSELKIKSQWLTALLERLGVKPKSDGGVRDDLSLTNIDENLDDVQQHRTDDPKKWSPNVANLPQKNRPPVMPTLTIPCDDPSPVEGQRSVNELAYDYDVRRLI